MSSVEAAASLFGSEESTSDLFASLGTDDNSKAPVDDLFSGDVQAASGEPNTNILDASNQESVVANTPYSEYNYQQVLGDGYSLYSHTQSTFTGQAASRRAELSVTKGLPNTYTPQSYVPPVTSVKKVAPASNSYTPQTYAASAPYPSYTSYNPPAPSAFSSTIPSNGPPQPVYSSSLSSVAGNATRAGARSSAPLPPPPVSSTITRPKLSNAYDPPFLPTKAARRVGRATDAQQAYNIYQPSNPPTSHPGSIGTATVHSVGSDAGVPPAWEGHMEAPAAHNYSERSPTGPSSSLSSRLNPGLKTAHYAGILSQDAETVAVRNNHIEDVNPNVTYLSDGINGVHNPDKFSSLPGFVGHSGRSHTPHSSSVGLSSSPMKSAQSSAFFTGTVNTSPSKVPLPHSPPPKPKVDSSPETYVLQENLIKQSFHHGQYKPPEPLKREATPGVLCAPVGPHATNHVPRMTPPLQNEYLPSQPYKVPPSLNLDDNSYLYNSVSPTTTLSTFPRPLDISLSPRHPITSSHDIVKPSLNQYAPSPSLVGANDPLSRTSARAPVVSFGFGGKFITCFHGMPGLNAGFDIALSARTSSELKVRVLQKILPESALNSPGQSYPGPLVSDPGTPSLTLVRPGASTQAKTKKSGVLSYLSNRLAEINQGLGYLAPVERQTAENKMVLVKILKALVEYDGRLFGIPQAESAVRLALVPRFETELTLQDALHASYQTAPLDEVPIGVTDVRPSALLKIEGYLMQGDRRQAYQYALDQKLWAHAMIIASSIDKESWKEVVNEFLRKELAASSAQLRGSNVAAPQYPQRSWESLRVAYSFFSGQGPAAIQELAPPVLLQRSAGILPTLPVSAMTPRTPNFVALQPPLHIPPENLAKWAETVAMMISSPFTPTSETSGALVALGDQLMANDWTEAAHVCYLLSPYAFSSQPPLINGFGAPGVRITLVGAKNPGSVLKDSDSLLFSEILEFAVSLLPIAKGQETFHGLPHLQVYRYIRAVWLAEMGDMQLASRYCEAVTASLSQSSSYTTPVLLEQLHGLQQRLTGVFHNEKSNSWIGSKISKPSFDSIGGWLEGRFTKLVTGDGDASNQKPEFTQATNQHFGPFAHYSTISSATPSSRSSPQPTTSSIPPPRTSSAMGPPSYAPVSVKRSLSAMAMRSKPPVQVVPTSPYFSSSQSSPTGYEANGYSPQTETARSSDDQETPLAGSTWWSSNANETSKTPTATSFMQVQGDIVHANSDGFISLMDNQTFAFESQPPSRQASRQASLLVTDNPDDDNDNLGFGNPKPKPIPEEKEREGSPVKETMSPEKKSAENPPLAGNGGSWFGGWFKRSTSTSTGSVKANLGEEKSLYYDKELKRWINNKAEVKDAAKAAPPPPPPRAQTASPGMSTSRAIPPSTGAGPPRASSVGSGGPPRSVSAIDLTTEPPTKVPPRIRSNLAPSAAETLPSSQSSPVGNSPARPRSQAAKRTVRSRYVDVFQQENGGSGGS